MSRSQARVAKVEAIVESVEVVAGAPARVDGGPLTPEDLQQTIAVAAYYLAERRNFEPGHELQDWLDAKAEAQAQIEGLKGFPA